MIPKIIHYCWFGRNPKTELIEKCIESWKKNCPDYQIIEWNEDNFDINYNEYVHQAYELKKWAFVSDIARLNALKEYGGIYLDTDVEVFSCFDAFLDKSCVLGFEQDNYVATSFIACQPNHPLLDSFLKLYENITFSDNGVIDHTPNTFRITELLLEKGLIRNNQYQEIQDGITVYPQEYFSPYQYGYGISLKNDKTICIHYFDLSWKKKRNQKRVIFKRILCFLIGYENTKKIRNLFTK